MSIDDQIDIFQNKLINFFYYIILIIITASAQ